jgi:hypothetical protein
MNNLVPRLRWNNERLHLVISDEDDAKLRQQGRGPGYKCQVTDLITGRRFRVFGAHCGLPECWCDVSVAPMESGAVQSPLD